MQVDDVQINTRGEILDPEDPEPEKEYITSLQNKSFEIWSDGKPEAWVGAATNFAASRILPYTADFTPGQGRCSWSIPELHIIAFTSKAYSIEANTEYTVTYWAGQG